jgi:hypothetical protein
MDNKYSIKNVVAKFFQRISTILVDQPFYLQSQMDIHPHSKYYNQELIDAYGGFYCINDNVKRNIIHFDLPWDTVRRDMIILLLKNIVINSLKGDMVELGVYKGHTAKLIHHYLPEKIFYLFDTYEGFSAIDIDQESNRTGEVIENHFESASADKVLKEIRPINDNVIPIIGRFPDSLPDEFNEKKFSFVHIDMDLYSPIKSALSFFYEKVEFGGYILIHDYNAWRGAKDATDEFFKDKLEKPIPMPDKSGSALIQKLTKQRDSQL